MYWKGSTVVIKAYNRDPETNELANADTAKIAIYHIDTDTQIETGDMTNTATGEYTYHFNTSSRPTGRYQAFVEIIYNGVTAIDMIEFIVSDPKVSFS